MQLSQMYLKVLPLLVLPLLIVASLPSNLAIAQTANQTQVSDNKAIALTLQKSIARELKGGETHSYVVSLKTGQFFQAIAEQQRIDIVILLYISLKQYSFFKIIILFWSNSKKFIKKLYFSLFQSK